MHGLTDLGAIVRIVLAGPGAEAVAAGIFAGVRPEWWPGIGLEPIRGRYEPDMFLNVNIDWAPSMDRAESDLGLFTAEHLGDWVAVHAAVVRVDGTVLVVPGPSHAGKSSLCAAVLDAGGEVLSDEYALVSPDGDRVAGWPRRVRLRTDPHQFRRVGTARGGEVDHVDLVAVVEFDPHGDDPLEVVALTQADLVTALLANTVCAASRPRFAFDAIVAFARRTPGVQGVRGDAAVALEALVHLARAS